jgi:hypothetical protein
MPDLILALESRPSILRNGGTSILEGRDAVAIHVSLRATSSGQAMNIYTGASVPMIVGSSQLNNLQQAFISDPQSTNLSQFIPKIVPFVQGSDLSSLAVLTSAHLAALAAENGRPGTSMMIYESMRQNGLVQ